jgi:hypothetical protein
MGHICSKQWTRVGEVVWKKIRLAHTGKGQRYTQAATGKWNRAGLGNFRSYVNVISRLPASGELFYFYLWN